MEIQITFDELLKLIPDARVCGTARPDISGMCALEEAGPSDISFLSGEKFISLLESTKAGVILVPNGLSLPPSEDRTYIVVDDPSLCVAKLSALIEKRLRPVPAPGIHPSAVIEGSSDVDPSASIGPFCYVGNHARIAANAVLESHVHVGRGSSVGEGTHLHPNVVLHDYCETGRNVIIQPGAVIGGDGFGYIQVGKLPDLYHQKVPQIGRVVIGDNVEIGANSSVDRARLGETRIGEGTKIDSLVQIGHNVHIGRRCIICAQVGISGSTKIGDYVVIWGQAGIVGHIEIGDFSFIGAQAGVAKSLPVQAKVTGTPARPLFENRRSEAALAKLPQTIGEMKAFMKSAESKNA